MRRAAALRRPAAGGEHPFLAHPGPIAFAHRGGAEDAPENTLPAFEAAVALGYRYLETDVHATSDGILVAFHDDRLERTTDRSGRIAELSAADVAAADAGFSYSRDGGRSFPFRGRGVRIPRLDELLLRWPEVHLNLDPKADGCVDPLIALLDRLDAWELVCLGAFSDSRLRRLRALSGGRACTSMGPRAVALARATSAASGLMPRSGADCVQVPQRYGRVPLVSGRFVRAAHRAGLPVHVWTIDQAETMGRLLDLGVDGIMTDHPRVLRELFARRGLSL